MKKFVCESLNSFIQLSESIQEAKKIFSELGYDEKNEVWKKFEEAFKNSPEIAEKFSKWLKNEEYSDPEIFLTDLDILIKSYQKALSAGSTPEEINNQFKTFRSYDKGIEDFINKKISEKSSQNININDQIPSPLRKPVQLNIPGMHDRLWIYGVLIKTRKETYVKFGDHRGPNREEAKKYALDETIGKARGVAADYTGTDIEALQKEGKEVSDVALIFVEDVTDIAEKMDPRFIYGNKKGFDHYVRKLMPGVKGVITNPSGGKSLELHKHEISQTDEEIIKEWEEAIKSLYGENQEERGSYKARPFHNEMNDKIKIAKSDKHLLGAATGAGKEAITLSSIIYIDDTRSDLFNENTVHVSTATIPVTELELFEELARRSGMKMSSGEFIDFSRIKPYCLNKFAKSYEDGLSITARKWFSNPDNVKKVETVSEIGKRSKDEIPVLFGSFQDLGLKTANEDPKGFYKDLKDRIGILSIGEGHQFLSNVNNKLWTSIKEKLNFKFLFLITGTPYDFIFNESGHLYFSPEERTLFTRNDLYEERKKDPNGPFGKYPEFNYYSIDIKDAIKRIKEEAGEDWIGEEGFKYEKFFEVDKKTNEFKYKDAIVFFFKRLLAFDEKGKKDSLSIGNAPGLCELAKRHIIIALPIGSGGISAQKYIPMLDKLLEDNGATGIYKSLEAYEEEDLGQIKKIIDEDKSPTMTLTCRKFLTGTNIPAWGSLIFLRPIGNSIKFFEQATGRIGRPFEKKDPKTGKEIRKENVGVFLAEIDNIVNIHVSADEKILGSEGKSQEYKYVRQRTFDNYNFFGVKNGEWKKMGEPELIEAVERASMNSDYGINLCLNNPKAPANFNLEFRSPSISGKERVEVTAQGNEEAKNKKIEERTKQLAFDFGEAKDKDKWYKDMIKTHIPKIVTICLLRDIPTIQEFEKEIKRALQKNDETLLDMIGKGVDMIPLYIGDDRQIDRTFINRWIDKNKSLSSDKGGEEGFKQRYDVINNKMDIKKLSESIVFDPIKLTDEICQKIKGPLKKAKKIMIIEKNGSFSYSILKEIGFENANRLTLIILEPLSEEIIRYIFGNNEKLPEIKFIKDTKELLNMPEFDVIVGNPPYQWSSEDQTKQRRNNRENLWSRFVFLSSDILKDNGFMGYIIPQSWMSPSKDFGNKSIIEDLFIPYQAIYINLDCKKYFNVGSTFSYFIFQKRKNNQKTVIEANGEKTSLDFRDIPFLPTKINEKTLSISKKFFDYPKKLHWIQEGLKLRDKSLFSDFPSAEFPIKAYHTPARGGTYKYYKEKSKEHHLRKILVSLSGKYKPVLDNTGNLSQTIMNKEYILKNNESGESAMNVLTHPLYLFIIEKIFKYTGWVQGDILVNLLPDVDFSKDWKPNDPKLYKEIGLNDDEILYIKNYDREGT